MSEHPADHAWYTSDGFQEDESNEPFAFVHGEPGSFGGGFGVILHGFNYGFVVAVESCRIHAESQ